MSKIYIPKDLQNLGKVLDTWQEQNNLAKTNDGVGIENKVNSVWFDNWRMVAEGSVSKESWGLYYKGRYFVQCDKNRMWYIGNKGEHDEIPNSKLEIGETLKFICDKLGCKCKDINTTYTISFSSWNASRDYAETGIIDVFGDMRSNSAAVPRVFYSKKDAQEYLDGFVEGLKKDEKVGLRIEAGLLTFDVQEREPRYSPLNREKEKAAREQEKKEARQKQQKKEIKRTRSRGSIER